MKGPMKAKNDRKGAYNGKNEEKGAYEGQNEDKRPFKKVCSAKNNKGLRPYMSLILALLIAISFLHL